MLFGHRVLQGGAWHGLVRFEGVHAQDDGGALPGHRRPPQNWPSRVLNLVCRESLAIATAGIVGVHPREDLELRELRELPGGRRAPRRWIRVERAGTGYASGRQVPSSQYSWSGTQALPQAPQCSALIRVLTQPPSRQSPLPSHLRPTLLRASATRATVAYEAAPALFHALEDRMYIGYTLHNLGLIASVPEDYARAETLFDEALVGARHRNDENGVVLALGNLGLVAFLRPGGRAPCRSAGAGTASQQQTVVGARDRASGADRGRLRRRGAGEAPVRGGHRGAGAVRR